MEVSVGSPHRLRFGVFEVDLKEGQLSKQGRSVKLQGQPFQILSTLLERGGDLVTRDDLRRKLWPEDTFVDFDRSLNKAMNKLRLALGDSAENPRFIETIRRRGYRFIAPVTRLNGASPDAPVTDPAALEQGESPASAGTSMRIVPRSDSPVLLPPRRGGWLWRAYAIAITLVVVVCGVMLVRTRSALHSASSSLKPRPSVAVLGFRNLSGNPGQEWLSTALPDWLSTELAAGDQLRAIPEQSVDRVRTDLGLPEGDSLAKDSLAQIHKALGADLIVAGSYATLASGASGKIRLDLELQDARNGKILGAMSETGTESDLFDLVQRAGAWLRSDVGVPPASAEQEAHVRLSQPSNVDAAKLYSEGLAKLQAFDALAARNLLNKAVAAEPGNAMSHSALAVAWRALGYDNEAKAEAKKAFDLSSNLDREQRLQIEARYDEVSANWGKAIDIYRTLFEFFPDNLDYGLALANAQINAGEGKNALVTIQMLRSLPPPSREDPRIDLVDARAAESQGNFKRDAASAAVAAAKAESARESLLLAKALDDEGWALENLGEIGKAVDVATKAQQLFAKEGDLSDVAASTTLKAIALQEQGDLPGAKRMFTQGLDFYRRTGNQFSAAAELNNLGAVQSYMGDLGGAMKRFEASHSIYQKLNYADGLALTTGNMGSSFLESGEPVKAQQMYMRAFDICQRIGDRSKAAGALEGLASVFRAEGNLEEARKYAAIAIKAFGEIGDKQSVAQARLVEAEILIEQNEPAIAVALARGASEELKQERVTPYASFALAVMSRALLEQGKLTDARNAVSQAYSLAGKPVSWDVHMFLAITAARVRAASGSAADRDQAVRSLRATLSEAQRDGMVVDAFETRLALGEIEIESGDTPETRSYLSELRNDAASQGLGFIAHKAAALLAQQPN